MSTKKTYIILTAVILLTTLTQAADIAGVVIDAAAGKPLAGTHLRLKNTNWITTSDEAGNFSFDNLPAGGYVVTVTSIGYGSAQKRVEAGNLTSTNFVIELHPAPIELPEVTVQVSPAQGKIYSGAQIRQTQAADLGAFLEKTGEAVLLDGGGAQSTRITIRGSKPGQVAVYLDGHQLNDPLTGEVDLKNVSLNNIDQITVKPNADLTQGSGGAGGAVELHSSNLQGLSLQSGTGSFGWRRYQAGFGGGFKQHNFDFSLEQEIYQGGYTYADAEGNSQERRNNDYLNRNLFLRWNRESGGWKTEASFHHYNTDRGAPGSIDNPAVLDRISRAQSAAALNVEYRGTGYTSINRLSYMDTYAENSTFYFFGGDTIPFPAEHRAEAYNFDSKVIRSDALGSNTAGISGRWDVVASSSMESEEDRQDIAVYAQRNITFHRLHLAAAIRSDSYRNFGDYISTNLSARYTPWQGKKLAFTVNLSQGTTLPTFNELFYAEDVFAAPNPDLRPEKVRSWDAGGEYAMRKIRFRAAYFHRSITDMIIWQESVTSTGKKWKPVNNDQALIKGVELWAQTDWKNWELTVSSTMSDPRNHSIGYQDKYLVFQPRIITAETMTYNWRSWNFSFSHRYTSRRYTLQANTKWVEPVSLFGASMGYNWEKAGWKAETAFSVDNLTDEAYSIIRGSPMPGRNYKVSVVVSRD